MKNDAFRPNKKPSLKTQDETIYSDISDSRQQIGK